jgi:transposase InsO family protein
MLEDKQFRYWPVSSVALYALRNNILPLSLNTWYKYANKFGLARVTALSRRKKTHITVRAEIPHPIWHADITSFVTTDNVRHYIYLVVDNFSRKILSWLIDGSVKAEYRKVTIDEALKKASPKKQPSWMCTIRTL